MGRVPLQELKSEVVESIEVGFEEEKREGPFLSEGICEIGCGPSASCDLRFLKSWRVNLRKRKKDKSGENFRSRYVYQQVLAICFFCTHTHTKRFGFGNFKDFF